MKILLGYCFLCIFLLVKVQSKPQITKLFPVKELAAFHERTNEIKPLDKFLLKLRAAYNFVFNKAEDTSNVVKILANDAATPNPEIEALKLIWANVISPAATPSNDIRESNVIEGRSFETGNEKENAISSNNKKSSAVSDDDVSEIAKNEEKDDWLDSIEAPKPLGGLELQDNSHDDDENDDDDIFETTTPQSTLQLPTALGRQLLEWLGALLGLTYGAYTKVAQAVKT